jgi:uncharacterized damage-inducible protein DinB
MFERLDTFLAVWDAESGATLRVLRDLTDESLDTAVAPGHRTLGRLAWHLVQTIPELLGRTGLPVDPLPADEPPPASAAACAERYAAASDDLVRALREHWTDATLAETDDMYGERWTRAQSLGALLLHQAHHRGQITVLMRQAGLSVPGIYGPSQEEWAQWGMEAPQI